MTDHNPFTSSGDHNAVHAEREAISHRERKAHAIATLPYTNELGMSVEDAIALVAKEKAAKHAAEPVAPEAPAAS
jgi:uncharacterized protein YoaH (UPF0181 family)